jgi:hypothetical protein
MTNAGLGSSAPPLPSRKDDHEPRTPSAATRRERFAYDHPEIPITTRREGTRLVFDVAEPGRPVEAYSDADAMMDDLEARHPAPDQPAGEGRTTEAGNLAASPVIKEWARHHSLTRQLAARLARELASRPDHSPFDSSMKIAAKYGVSNTMAVKARNLLAGAHLIYKSGRHYRKAAPRRNGNGTEG